MEKLKVSAIYLANAFFPVPGKDPRGPGGRVSVPAPVDSDTPNVDWWYDKIAKLSAHLAAYGYWGVAWPPFSKTQSGSLPTGTGYGTFDLRDLGIKDQMGSIPTRFGTKEQLQRVIAIVRANGMHNVADVVLHQLAGGRAGHYLYNGAPSEEFPNGEPGVGRGPRKPSNFRGDGTGWKTIPPCVPEDDVPDILNDFEFGDEVSYQHCQPPRYTTEDVKDYFDWLVSVTDIDGARIDDTKGLWPPAVLEFLTTGQAKHLWAYNEYFDGYIPTLQWYRNLQKRRMSQIDFPAHWSAQDVCDRGHSMHRWRKGTALADVDGMGAVPYVESPDTDLSPDQKIVFNKLLAYARMLLILEGRALVYHRDHSSDPGCYGLGPWIDNMVWCRSHLIGGERVDRFVDDTVLASERLGFQVGMPGALSVISNEPVEKRVIQCQTAFGANKNLNDYTGLAQLQGLPGNAWTDSRGRVELHVPSNEFGAARSYGCWAPDGVGNKPPAPPRLTTHAFIAALADPKGPSATTGELDIAPARDGRHLVGRIWCAAATEIKASVKVALPTGASMRLILRSETGIFLDQPVKTEAGNSWDERNPRDGWVSLILDVAGLPEEGLPFALPVTYTGTRGLPNV